MMLAPTLLCQATLRCPKLVTSIPALHKRWPQLWSKRDKASSICHDRSGHQRSEAPTPDEPHQSPQEGQPCWASGSSDTGGAEPSTQHSNGGEAAPDPQPPSTELQVPWGLDTLILMTTMLLLGTIAVDLTAASLQHMLFPGPVSLRIYTFTILLDALARLLVMADRVQWIRRLFRPPPLASFPLEWKPLAQWDPQLALQIVAYMLAQNMPTVLSSIHGPVAEYEMKVLREQTASQVLGKGDWVADGLYLLAMCVFGPIWEELVFRGFLIPSLQRYLPAWAAVLVSAIAFSAAHRYPTLDTLVAGLLLGAAFLRARNLWAPILLHSAGNFWGFLDYVLHLTW